MKLFYVLLFLLIYQVSLAQIPVQNSLSKAQLYYELPKDSLIYYANYAIKNAETPLDKGLAMHYLGNTYRFYGDLNAAIENYNKENLIFKKLVLENTANKIYINNYANSIEALAIVFSNQSNYTKALDYHFKAKKLFEKTGNTEKLCALSNNIGIEYQSLNKFELANNNFRKAIQLNSANSISNVLLYTNLAKSSLRNQNYTAAKNDLDKALSFIDNEKNPFAKGELYNNLAFYYYKISDFENQKKYVDSAISCFKDDQFGLTDSYYYLGLYYLAKNNELQAVSYFNKSLEYCKNNNIIEVQSYIEKEFYQLYKSENNYKKALLHYQNYSKLNNQLIANNNEKAVAYSELIDKYDKQKITLQLYKEKQKMRWYCMGFIGLSLIAMLAFLSYRNRQKLIKKNIILEKDISEFHQKALYLQMNPHFIFNCLGSISGFILQNENDTALEYLNHFARLMRLTLENSKEKYISIEKEIESITQYFELEKLRHEAVFSYSIKKLKSVEEGIKMPPMLLQPLIENAIIHGVIPQNNGLIDVNFSIEKNQLKITITDDGVGYYISKAKKEGSVLSHKSMALDIVKQRIETLKGQFVIEEIKENGLVKGTQILILLPIL